jgi:transposase-like protein
MYHVAYGFIDSETEENWMWFMAQLHKVIGDLPLLVICTDAYLGLTTAVKYVFPMAKQRECFKHLMDNYVKKKGCRTYVAYN